MIFNISYMFDFSEVVMKIFAGKFFWFDIRMKHVLKNICISFFTRTLHRSCFTLIIPSFVFAEIVRGLKKVMFIFLSRSMCSLETSIDLKWACDALTRCCCIDFNLLRAEFNSEAWRVYFPTASMVLSVVNKWNINIQK